MKKKLLSTLLLAGTLLIGSTVSAYAQDVSSDPLQPYEDRLEELSTELGTDLAIVAPEDGTIEDAIDFYSSMSMDEFDSYVKDAYEEAESLDVVTEEYVSEESSSLDVAPLASIAYYQKYFYNSGNTNNCFGASNARKNRLEIASFCPRSMSSFLLSSIMALHFSSGSHAIFSFRRCK